MAVQPAAYGLIDLIALDIVVLTDMALFDMALAVGLVEATVEMILGIMLIIIKILEVALHVAMGMIYDIQTELAVHSMANAPSEDLIKPLGEDVRAFEDLWNNLASSLLAYLQDWWRRFVDAPHEKKAIMAGDYVADLLAFIATWEMSATKIGTIRLPALAAVEPELAAAVAGGGSAGLKGAGGAAAIAPPALGIGGPVGGIGSSVARMSGRSRGERPAPSTDPRAFEKRIQQLEDEIEVHRGTEGGDFEAVRVNTAELEGMQYEAEGLRFSVEGHTDPVPAEWMDALADLERRVRSHRRSEQHVGADSRT